MKVPRWLSTVRTASAGAVEGARSNLRHRHDHRRVLGLALSGGGARASFQLGALRYLYDVEGITPDVVSGTSAGSILAAALAQHGTHEGQRRALAEVDRIWSGMTSSSDIFTELAWYARLRAHLPTWMRVIALRQARPGRASLTQTLSSALSHAFGRGPTDNDIAATAGTARTAGTPAAEVAVKNHTISPVETLTALWEGARATSDLEMIIRGVGRERSAFRPGPIVEALLEPQVFDPVRLAASRVKLRITAVSLESGELHYITGRGELHDRDDRPLAGLGPVDIVDALTASCAIPGIFPPIKLGREHYVDGGMRENLPVAIAYEMGADEVIAIVSSPPGPAPEESYAERDILSIIMRTASGILPDELQRLQVDAARARGATVIAPLIEVHDMLTVDPGLIRIATDYGYLRARDVMTGAGAHRQSTTHDVIELRRQLWALEDRLFAPPEDDDEVVLDPEELDDDLLRIGELKLHLRTLLESAPASELPHDADRWWREWERHPYPIELAPTWPTGSATT
ncbi:MULTISPECIES: patatin-like phospholipase family protein [unclassified Pseudactinotalea]|uniref:patatin-like phospholipase family protein n=1 Tax=unclassified Pseudactinotalea TaxID=2649176 RepID=UPI00128B7F88|nr:MULTISPECIES: patatin-like phospholipase family protein [unclassified Pseudactinotalea]MPV49060.1 hypothetical protein [Pseudactinotalea sp. HY160]QGH68266.1 hypothetical protein GCE65_01075 [Pseudactinotalea sp. HY158]